MRSTITQKILAETPEETKIFVNLYTDIVIKVNQILKANDWSQKYLADRIGKKPSEINKWLKGEHNFTLRSIAKLQAELDEPIIEVKKRETTFSNEKQGVMKGNTSAKNFNPSKGVKFKEPKVINISKKHSNELDHVS